MKTNRIVLASLFLALGLIIPYVCGHAAGIPGTVLLPMHLSVFVAGMVLGPVYGLGIGLLTPVLSMMLTGMPSGTTLITMIVELGVYGYVSGFACHSKSKKSLYIYLVMAMIAGRIAYAIVLFIGKDIFQIEAAAILLKVWSAFTTGLIGVGLQFLLVPPIVVAIRKVVKDDRYSE
ncbi:MAG: ECF transporter S component [Erysipelotrichaceae bacterium]